MGKRDENGILRCEVCGEPIEMTVKVFDELMKVGCICDCRKKEIAEQKRREAEEERNHNRKVCFGKSKQQYSRFEDSQETEALKTGKNYADKFKEFKKQGKGLLLYGTVGTGKSHMAACIANALIDDGYRVLMTNFATMVNVLQSSFDGRQEYIDSLNRYALLIIDDLGAERDSEYMQEQVFNIIDARYRSGLPMIITTNLTNEELKKPENIGRGRIYDRILERCHPIEVKGGSFRRQKLKDDFAETERILKGE